MQLSNTQKNAFALNEGLDQLLDHWAKDEHVPFECRCDGPRTTVTISRGALLLLAQRAAAAARDRMLAEMKSADGEASACDCMPDSDDCITGIRGNSLPIGKSIAGDESAARSGGMKDHEKRELVNLLTKLARDFAETLQLRERIGGEVLPALEAVQAAERERWRKWLSEKAEHKRKCYTKTQDRDQLAAAEALDWAVRELAPKAAVQLRS